MGDASAAVVHEFLSIFAAATAELRDEDVLTSTVTPWLLSRTASLSQTNHKHLTRSSISVQSAAAAAAGPAAASSTPAAAIAAMAVQ